MGGVWGVVSTKFLVSAAGLLIASRVGYDHIQAIVDPAYRETEISARLAEQLHLAQEDGATLHRDVTIGIGARQFDLAQLHVVSQLPGGAGLRIGQDVLRQHVFLIDLRRDSFSLVLPSEYRHDVRNLSAIPLRATADGTWYLPIVLPGGNRLDAVFDLKSQCRLCVTGALLRDTAGTATIGPITVEHPELQPSESGSTATLGLRVFAERQIILDLPHGALWIDARRASH